jgi:DNA polymerase-3 subunit epsilon
MENSSNTVFSKTAKKTFEEKAKFHVNSLIDVEKKLSENKEAYCRNKDDYKMSTVLTGKGLGLYSGKDAGSLQVYLSELYGIPKEFRMNRVVCFDTETTSNFNGYAVSIALILYNIDEEKVEDSFYQLINPLADISYDAQEVHGISYDDIKNEETFESLEKRISSFFERSDMIVGHNIDFDLKVIEREYDRLNKLNPSTFQPYFCTMKMGKETVQALDVRGKLKDPRLEEAVTYFNIPEKGDYHNALVDTEMCLEVFKHLLLQ